MKTLKLFLPLFMLMAMGFNSSTVSVKMISGTVTDKNDGKPLAGVAVLSMRDKKGTVTDASGKYSLALAEDDKTIQFSAIGYKTLTVKVKNNQLNVTMEHDVTRLEEVVVVRGYSSGKRDYSSESRASVSSAPVSTALAGRAAGVSIRGKSSASFSESKSFAPAPAKADKESGADKTHDRPYMPNRPQANQLTAGEWNDLENWDFWTELMHTQEWSAKQSHWQFYTKKRISVSLKNKLQQPLNNYNIAAFHDGQLLWKAKSNFEGKAELWPSLYNNEQEQVTLVISTAEGKEVYRKIISPVTRKLNIVMDRNTEKIKNLDVLFMVDATGSMGDEIDYLKSELEDIIGRLNGRQQLNTRTALVFYRDHGDEYLVRDFGFGGDLSHVKLNLSKQHASGGGDFEEAVEEAMENAIGQQQWTTATASAKIMFMILDAPPHHDSEKISSLQRSIKEAAAKGIILIPVVASGIDKNTEFLMRFIAMATNGTYVFITDDSGIGNSHLKPTIGRYQVEQLNNLLNRLINKYAGLGTDGQQVISAVEE